MALLANRVRVSNAKVRLEDFSDEEVIATTRFPRSAVEELCELLGPDLERPTRRSNALPVDSQVLTALHFYSSGSFQWVVGRSTRMSQPSVSRVVDGVTQALCKLARGVIKFPTSQQEITANKLAFYNLAGFPNVIGAVDGTHVRIKSPSQHEDVYVNRKGAHTINVQAVCDADLKVINLVAKYPGSAHDAFIWRNSSLHYMLSNGHVQGGWLLGGSQGFFKCFH